MAHAVFSSSIIRSVVLLAALVAGACGASADSPSRHGPVGDSGATAATPIEVERVVSLVPTLTEILIEIGAADRLVGIGRFDPPVPGRPDVPRLGDAFSVSLEAVAALEPDVVFVNGVGLAERLAPLAPHIRVEIVATDRLADVHAGTLRLGALTGRALAARTLSDRMHAAVTAARDRARQRAGGADAPRVLVVVQRRPLYVAGGGSYVDELLTAVGAVNAAGDLEAGWPVLSSESVVARAPDLVLDASFGTSDPDDGGGGVTVAPITGVPPERFVRLGAESEPLFRAGPRLPAALALLERVIFEECR